MSDMDQKRIVQELEGVRFTLFLILIALAVADGCLFTIATHA